jgi:hypothetical protein
MIIGTTFEKQREERHLNIAVILAMEHSHPHYHTKSKQVHDFTYVTSLRSRLGEGCA